MGWGVNQKAVQKREKQANKKKQEQRERQQKKEKEKWKDEITEKKFESAQQKQQKRLQQLARKRQLKQLAEKQEEQMQKQSKKNKGEFNEKKLTQAELMQRQQQRLMQQMQMQNRQVRPDYPQENVNKKLQDYEVANSVEGVLEALDDGSERHPQRRFKAAFQAFCQKREQSLKIDYPKLKRSQRLQMMRKQFQKHPDNPYNKKNVVAYNYNPRKQQQQKVEE